MADPVPALAAVRPLATERVVISGNAVDGYRVRAQWRLGHGNDWYDYGDGYRATRSTPRAARRVARRLLKRVQLKEATAIQEEIVL